MGLTIYFALTPAVGDHFTEFYVLGSSGKAADYPTNLTLGSTGTVILGLVNHEYEVINYTVVIKLGDDVIGTMNNITLSNNEKWEVNYTYAPTTAGRLKLEFLLFKEGVETPCQNLHLWITVA